MYSKYVKRLLDIVFSFTLLVILFPIILVVAILVRIKLGTPIIFKQKRPGKNGIIFELYKFRTMTDEKDDNGELLPDGDRLKNFGKVLRSTSLDELPELVNILKGEMSFVGPRPLLAEYLELYSDEQKRRHEVKPGLTGLAQINGRNNLEWNERFKLDVQYVDTVSFTNDLKILFKTISLVFKRENISQEGIATVEKFKGTNVIKEEEGSDE